MAQLSKILYLVTQSEWGGAQRYIFDLAKNLPAENYVVTVAAGGNGPLLSKFDETRVSTVTVENLVRPINPFRDILCYFELVQLFKKQKPDIVHLNSSKAGAIGAIAAKHAGVKKVVYTVHGFVFNEPMPVWKKKFYLMAERISAKYKDKIICVSDFDRQIGLENKIAAEDKLIVIHNGIENLQFLDKSTARQELNLPQDKIIVGTIANFYPTKGLSYLIEAAKMIVAKNKNILFQLIGFGQLENELKTQVKSLDLENNFMVGSSSLAKDPTNGYKYLKAFDIFTLSSVKEGFPYALLEAMAAGLPIVATKVGGVAEAINQSNGILVEPRNSKALAESIGNLVENENLVSQLANQAKQDVKSKFTLKSMLNQTSQVYHS